MITKLIARLIIMTVLCSINLIAYAEIMDLKGKYYEKDGCIYLIGHSTEEEKLAGREYYKQRMVKREKQVEIELQKNHEIKIEKIRAEAVKVYAKYLSFLQQEKMNTYRERTGAIAKQSKNYVPRITLKSIKGDTGTTGFTGARGLIGTTGLAGAIGSQGDTGEQGTQGIQGDVGDPGAYFSDLPVYDHNIGAIVNGGLSVGDYYRTSAGTLRVVYEE